MSLITDGGNLSWSAQSSFVYVNPGTIGQLSYYASAGSALSATSSIYLSAEGYFGIGTTTPSQLLSVGGTSGSQFLVNNIGQIVAGIWQGDILELAYGGTGASTATGARLNLGLSEAFKFSPNSTGTDGWLWQADGDGRGLWVATGTLGLVGSGSETYAKLIGTTSAEYNGAYATTSLVGYEAANTICAAEFSNSFMCRTYDILVTIEQDDISQWAGSAWIAEGPPGYTSNSNDCNGWTSSSTIMLGAFWSMNSNGGGAGWLTNCSETKPISCCSSQ